MTEAQAAKLAVEQAAGRAALARRIVASAPEPTPAPEPAKPAAKPAKK